MLEDDADAATAAGELDGPGPPSSGAVPLSVGMAAAAVVVVSLLLSFPPSPSLVFFNRTAGSCPALAGEEEEEEEVEVEVAEEVEVDRGEVMTGTFTAGDAVALSSGRMARTTRTGLQKE